MIKLLFIVSILCLTLGMSGCKDKPVEKYIKYYNNSFKTGNYSKKKMKKLEKEVKKYLKAKPQETLKLVEEVINSEK